MIIQGHHTVSSVRLTGQHGKAETSAILYLTPKSARDPVIIVTFTDAAPQALTLADAGAGQAIHYTLPKHHLGEFLGAFPVGSDVVSLYNDGNGEGPKLDLTHVESGTLLSDGDHTGLLSSRIRASGQSGTARSTLDPALVGVWDHNGSAYDIRPDGAYLVGDSSLYSLTDAGQTLTWGPMVFARLSGNDPQSVVGHWISAAGDEDILLRSDGTYVWHSIGLIPDAVGEWVIDGTTLTSWELRAVVTTSGDQISFDAVYGGVFGGTYALSNGDSTLTVDFSGTQVVYTRV